MDLISPINTEKSITLDRSEDPLRTDTAHRIRRWYAGRPVEICSTPERGRFLVAARDIEEGETVLLSAPYAFSVTEPEKRRVCSRCLRICSAPAAEYDLCCSDCGEVWYCTRECLQQDAPLHHFECSLLKAFLREADWAVTENRTEVRLILRLLARRALERVGGEQSRIPDPLVRDRSFNDFLLLSAHRERLSEEAIQMFEEVAIYLQQMDRWLSGEETSLIVETFLRARINGCSLWTTRAEIGQGVYLEASLLNHSCQPSLCQYRPEGSATLHFLAIEAIAKGEELSVCYFDAGDLNRRREYLWDTYLFECQCRRCREEEQGSAADYLAWRGRVGCPKAGCLGILLYGTPGAEKVRVCSECGLSLDEI